MNGYMRKDFFEFLLQEAVTWEEIDSAHHST